jgi:hypothetical protein
MRIYRYGYLQEAGEVQRGGFTIQTSDSKGTAKAWEVLTAVTSLCNRSCTGCVKEST